MQKDKISINPENFSLMEQEVIKKWNAEKSFKNSLRGEKEYVFYDGPPFANGLPHYGHFLTGFIKDLFARYQTMLGTKVERRFGWDCHGLPAELHVEKEINVSGKLAIENYGIERFNDNCRNSVLKYTKEWEEYVTRQGRWVDFENDYKTMNKDYMESVLWAFKTLYDKGLIYQSMRVMPYSWACETPVSDFETRLDNSYRKKESKAVTIGFKLDDKNIFSESKDVMLVIWTTTPWTLPSNLAVAVGEDIEYCLVETEKNILIIAKALLHKYEKEFGSKVIKKVHGKELVGLSYQPPFNYFLGHDNAFKILHGDFVTTEDGTGIVHCAPGFGEDDQALCHKHGIETVCPVDMTGKFTSPVDDYKGKQVFEANEGIIKYLKERGLWFKTEQYFHNYPHCWRTDTPLIYKAVPSWYVKVTAIKDKMIENNKKINWIPSHIKDGLFGKWLENARDWSISRNRFWGCPVPVWQSDDPKYPHIEVYGSIKELEDAFGVEVKDLHRPFIDTLTKPNPKDPTGKSKLIRVPEILDCWFESGSMPYAQIHYPFENQDWFESHFPADFIVEYLAQTRGWFYTLMVLSTALFNRPPFLNCICHGVILGDKGQKISKRLKNYPDPKEVFEKYGADALRWFMISSTVMKGQELVLSKSGDEIKEVLKTVIKPLYNAYNFLEIYKSADNIEPSISYESTNILDRYITSKIILLSKSVKKSLDLYDTVSACEGIEKFLEILNNWYIRRSRERFWRHEKDQDKINAYNTLYTVLLNLLKITASLLPFTAEAIFSNITGSSVHLERFPELDSLFVDESLVDQMEKILDACNAALRIRNENKVRIRQPLKEVVFIGISDDQVVSDDLKQLVLEEVNVKEWFNLDRSEINKYASYKVQINFPELAKRAPRNVKTISQLVSQGHWQKKGTSILVGDQYELFANEFKFGIIPKDEFKSNIAQLSHHNGLVKLDLNISKELELEGVARDVVRIIQQNRKDANFEITEKIKLILHSDVPIIKDAITQLTLYVKEQTLAQDLILETSVHQKRFVIEAGELDIEIRKH